MSTPGRASMLCKIFLCSSFLSLPLAASAQILVDASAPYIQPGPTSYLPGTARSSDGRTLAINERYLSLDGKPWLPVMGEFHFSRVPSAEWEDEILKMKAAGVNIIAAYVIWLHHEEVEGSFDWSGDRDLRRFATLCAKHHMYLYARIGPWAHGEVRNGGFPDWILTKGPTRVNDPIYMGYVARFYAAIGEQLHGLFWKDDGPVLGVQLENEYSNRSANGGEAHILALKKLAIASGLDVPLYSVTGWDHAVIPPGAVLPVFGGYPDAPWDASLKNLPRSEVYNFRFQSRLTGNMGAIGASSDPALSQSTDTPFFTAEMGGGIQDTYHRRPIIAADDVAAMFPVMLGSGVNLYGTYMFQGGQNPQGKRTTLQESQATSYPNDVPTSSYDFQAPLSEYGEERDSFRKLKLVNYFLNDFGDLLAPMDPHAPNILPQSSNDLSVTRLAVRSQNEHGFLFVNNYVRGAAMPARPGFQVRIALPGESLLLPEKPLDVPSGTYFIWPFNLELGSTKLRYSTAQLFTKLHNADETTFVFFCVPGVRCELSFNDQPGLHIETSSGNTVRSPGSITVTGLSSASDTTLTLRAADRKLVHILVLTQAHAEHAWRVHIADEDHLLITSQQFFADAHQITLQSLQTPTFQMTFYPALRQLPTASSPLHQTSHQPGRTQLSAELPAVQPTLAIAEQRSPGTAPPVTLGPPPSWRPQGVAQAPVDSTFTTAAASWKMTLGNHPLQGLSNLFLVVDYTGDVAHLNNGTHLLDDDFFNGLPWKISMKRFLEQHATDNLNLQIMPLRADSPIFLEDYIRKTIPVSGQVEQLRSIHLIPQYQLTLQAAPN